MTTITGDSEQRECPDCGCTWTPTPYLCPRCNPPVRDTPTDNVIFEQETSELQQPFEVEELIDFDDLDNENDKQVLLSQQSQVYLVNIYSERYYHEASIKEDILSNLSITIAIIMGLYGACAFFVPAWSKISDNLLFYYTVISL